MDVAFVKTNKELSMPSCEKIEWMYCKALSSFCTRTSRARNYQVITLGNIKSEEGKAS